MPGRQRHRAAVLPEFDKRAAPPEHGGDMTIEGSARMKAISVRTVVWVGALASLATVLVAGEPMEPKYEETRELMAVVSEAADLVAEEGVEAACEKFREEDSRWFHDDD